MQILFDIPCSEVPEEMKVQPDLLAVVCCTHARMSSWAEAQLDEPIARVEREGRCCVFIFGRTRHKAVDKGASLSVCWAFYINRGRVADTKAFQQSILIPKQATPDLLGRNFLSRGFMLFVHVVSAW